MSGEGVVGVIGFDFAYEFFPFLLSHVLTTDVPQREVWNHFKLLFHFLVLSPPSSLETVT